MTDKETEWECFECFDKAPKCCVCNRPIRYEDDFSCATDDRRHMHLNGECGWIIGELVKMENDSAGEEND